MRTEEQYCSYFDDIRQSLKKKEETMKQVVTEIEKFGCKKSNIQPNEITQFIQGYLND